MIQLSELTRCSDLNVTPGNWKTGGKVLMNRDWLISYRFYDDRHKEKYPKGKLIIIKGMNKYSSIEDRREATQAILDDELNNLKVLGKNPITKASDKPLNETRDLSEHTPFIESLNKAKSRYKGAQSTIDDLGDIIKGVTGAAKTLGYSELKISTIRRKHILEMLELASLKQDGSFSGHKYNKFRTYLKILFDILFDAEAVEMNFIDSIKKQKKGIIKKKRPVLSKEDVKKALEYFKEVRYEFYLFMQIFYHSGARKTELLEVKTEDVNLEQQQVRIIVKKDQEYREDYVLIKDVALKYWQEVMITGEKAQYVFGVGFKPGDKKMDPDVIRKYWYRHAKEKLGIEADFYSLKHLHTTKVRKALDVETAAKHNRHSEEMVKKHYDPDYEDEQRDKVKKLKGELGE